VTAIALRGVSKSFGAQTAVDRLSLEVPEGSIYGFLGPNGSGKTTTLRMIMRIFAPDTGTIATHGPLAYLPEERGLYKQMTVRDVLAFHAAIQGVRDAKKPIEAWLERFDLAAHGHKKVATLSKGMSQKVQFIATVIAKPKIVLLDEPFSGLDPVNAVVLRDAILELRREATIVFSTHDMAMAERTCDFVFMIHRGKKVLDGTLEQIQDAYGESTVRVRMQGDVSLEGLPDVVEITDFGKLRELRLASNGDPQRVLEALLARGAVRHFELARPSLHEIFVRTAHA